MRRAFEFSPEHPATCPMFIHRLIFAQSFSSISAACAAARRAMGTRYGLHET